MPNIADARVRAPTPRKTAYDIRDRKLRGFGVRVLPSGGKRFFVHCQHRGERVWKIVGDAGAMSVADARSRAVETLAAIRCGENVTVQPDGSLFETVAETVFQRHERLWKAGTLKVNRGYLRNQIMPHFVGSPIADISRRDVQNWFVSLHATPVAADRSMPVLSVIMKEAEAMGFRSEGSNPNVGIQPQPGLGMPDVTDRDADAKLAARGLGTGDVEHAGSQNAQFELAD